MKEIIKIDGINTNGTIKYSLGIWATMFIVASVVVGYGFGDWTKYIIMWLFSVTATWFAVSKLKISNLKSALITGVMFVVIGLMLDALISVRFTGTAIFSSFDYWVSYGLIISTTVFKGVMKK